VDALLEQAETLHAKSPALTDAMLVEFAADRALRKRLQSGSASRLLQRMLEHARQVAAAPATPLAERTQAVRLLGLGSLAIDGPVLEALLDQQQPADVQRAAVAALGGFDDAAAVQTILSSWPGLSPTVRSEAEETVFARAAGTTAALDALQRGDLRAADLSPSRLQFLRTHSDRALRQRAVELLKGIGGGERQQVVERYQSSLQLAGDVERGRGIFRKTCVACHRLEGNGVEIGPNLATIKNRGKEAILTNVLDPSREVNPQFVGYVVLTNDGLAHTGMIQSETATSVTLVRAENKTETILRSDIEQLRSTGLSLMPEGLEKDIHPQGLADLMAYLMATN
jgi:putative heme-binding domain-containing protein